MSRQTEMTATKHILLVDDDDALRETLAEQLELLEEFKTSRTRTGAEALECVRRSDVDLVILDVGLPDIDGREVCRLMRRSGVIVPIIMLTAMDSDSDTVLGLESGANDYVAKPFRFGTLLARVRAQLRRQARSRDATFTIGAYTFRPGARMLVDNKDGRKIRLTEKEAGILKYLYRAGGKPVNRDELLMEVWGYNSAVTTHTIETHIYRLRKKIEADPSDARLVVTESGGYRLAL